MIDDLQYELSLQNAEALCARLGYLLRECRCGGRQCRMRSVNARVVEMMATGKFERYDHRHDDGTVVIETSDGYNIVLKEI